jgi:glucokinase
MPMLSGIDIGGTKCAVSLGRVVQGEAVLSAKRRFLTPPDPYQALKQIQAALADLLAEHSEEKLEAVGVSCGAPLDSRRGLVLSPPNLPGWDEIDVLTPLRTHFGVPAALQNDANSGALAEWLWGAGRGSRSMVFLTFGTGMGAGLILDGRLYTGTNDLAGEVGHLRLEPDGPIGYGKAGSFEGFCSGGGIARLARSTAEKALRSGSPPSWCASGAYLDEITAETIALAAHSGDALALQVFEQVGRQLGRGLAVLVDLLNPECIVLGSIYVRQQALLEPYAMESLHQEALPRSLSVCRILPAALGENTGDLAALAVAWTAASAGQGVAWMPQP